LDEGNGPSEDHLKYLSTCSGKQCQK
ncbi:hypothetical protein CEXT_340531, partial [Caerostris extrusa]